MKIDTHNPTISPRKCHRLYRLSSIIIDYHRLSSLLPILVGNSWKRIPSIFRLAPGTCCIYRVRVWSNMDVILIECVVKGYHECGLPVPASETYFLKKKIGSHGGAFRMVSCKGQLGQENSIIAMKIDGNRWKRILTIFLVIDFHGFPV